MIPKVQKNEVYKGFEQNEQNTAHASVQMNKEMFKLLSSDIYKNKIRALIRELLTNAVDSHVAAGTLDKAIKIKPPTVLDPQFIVRDYGTGLSDEMVHKCFLSYGFSTKRDSNDFNGQFGIGAKVTFSYSQSFVITSYFEGVKTIFNLYINEGGIPTSTVVYKEATEEENGIEISISIFKNDFSLFEREIQWVLQSFLKGKFDVDGFSSIETLQDKVQMITDKIGFIRKNENTQSNLYQVVQENVLYPLDESRMTKILNERAAGDFIFPRKFTLVVFAENGTLSYTASREEIENTEDNYNYIDSIFYDFGHACEKFIEAEIEQLQNQFQASLFWQNAQLRYIQSYDVESMLLRKKDFSASALYKCNDVSFLSDYFIDTVMGNTKIIKYEHDKDGKLLSFEISAAYIANNKIKFFILDDTKKWRSKLAKVRSRLNDQTAFFVVKNYAHYEKHGLPEYFKDCGDYVEVIKASSINIEPVVREKSGKWFCESSSLKNMVRLENLDVDDEEKVYVVYMHSHNFHSSFLKEAHINDIMNILQDHFFYEHEKVVFARKARKENIEKRHPQCIDFFNELVERIKQKYEFSEFEDFWKYTGQLPYSASIFLDRLFSAIPNAPMHQEYAAQKAFAENNRSQVGNHKRVIFENFDVQKIYGIEKINVANVTETVYNHYKDNYPLILGAGLYAPEPKLIDNIKQLLGVK